MTAETLTDEPMTEKQVSTKRLTGFGVLMWLCGLFGVMFIVNGIFVYHAVSTHRGEDVPRSYRQGMEYNEVLAQRSTQAAINWSATLDRSDDDAVRLTVLNSQGFPVSDLQFEAKIRHPADRNKDQVIAIQSSGDGYAVDLPDVTGRWTLQANTKDGTPFFFEADLWL
ncbi:MAG: FixH family protein [Pseudomonadota bacterium]